MMISFTKIVIIFCIFLSFSTSAEKKKDSAEIFDAKINRRETMSISWMTVPMQMVRCGSVENLVQLSPSKIAQQIRCREQGR